MCEKKTEKKNKIPFNVNSERMKKLISKFINQETRIWRDRYKVNYIESRRIAPKKGSEKSSPSFSTQKNNKEVEKNLSVFGCSLYTNAKKLVYSL